MIFWIHTIKGFHMEGIPPGILKDERRIRDGEIPGQDGDHSMEIIAEVDLRRGESGNLVEALQFNIGLENSRGWGSHGELLSGEYDQ